jgi:hypothetical protein
MDIGPFRVRETILQSHDGTVYHSRQLRTLTPYRATFGYDVLVYVGRALFMHCKSEQEMDKYWNKLFADPIVVNTPNGQLTIQPQRTNNILERFFRDFKRSNRKKSGTVSLNRTLRSILADTPLVKNLDNPEYLEIILDGCNTLEERFEKIDSRMVLERLEAEKRNNERISPAVKKIIRRPDLPERLAILLNHSNIDTNCYLLS